MASGGSLAYHFFVCTTFHLHDLTCSFFKLFNYQVKSQLGKYTIAQDSYPLRFRVCVPPHVYMLLDIARASLWICTRGSLSSMVMHTPDARGS